MKRLIILGIFVSVLCIGTTSTMASMNIDFTYSDSATHDLMSPYSSLPGYTVDTFSGVSRPGWSYSGTYWTIYTGDESGRAAAPYDGYGATGDDSTPYLAIPGSQAGLNTNTGNWYGTTVDFGGGLYNYLGLHWGSMDTYNQIQFYNGGVLQDYVTGGAYTTASGSGLGVNRNGEGSQLETNSNSYVNIFTDFYFDTIVIRSQDSTIGSSPYAFELDNLTVAVPVPGAFLLGLFGLSSVGLKLRKFA